MRKIALICVCLAAVTCGGGSGPQTSTPGTPTQPTPPPAPTQPVNTWSVAGTLVDTVTRQPIAGATITPSWELAAVQTGADGRFELGAVANPPTTPYKVTVSGTDLISRELWITWQRGARTEVTIDAIRNRPPFSLEYYRQLARGTYDNDGPYAIFRWMESPKFYLKTVDQNGRAVEPEVLAVIREALPRAVTEFTGRKLSATVETGTESRVPATGWINVDIVRNPKRGAGVRLEPGWRQSRLNHAEQRCVLVRQQQDSWRPRRARSRARAGILPRGRAECRHVSLHPGTLSCRGLVCIGTIPQ
jgi:hypothetical protein